MEQQKMNVMLTIAAIGSLGAFGVLSGCSTGGSPDDTTTNEAALKAASPACASARDACRTKLESIASSIQMSCTTADACKAAFDAAKPDLQAAAMACETSIDTACVVDFGGDGGRLGVGGDRGSVGIGGGRSGLGHGNGGHSGQVPDGGGFPGHGPSAACQAAETTCRESLQSLRAMPPAACTTISTACSGQTPMTANDACKTAITDCEAAVKAAASSAHSTCGSAIAAACGAGHGG
jgi:hypothetical protein